MLDHAADVVERHFRQPGITVACELVLAALPYRLMHMHARSVVADDRLRHERRGLAIDVRRVVYAILQDLQPVGALHQRFELGADLVLAGCGNFMMVHLDFDAHLLHRKTHRRTNVLQRIDGRHRKIAALDRRPVSHVAVFELLGR